VDAVFYFPLDVPLAVKRTLDIVRPDALLLMETELWPNVLHLTRQSGAKTFLVNGRVSDNLLQRAPKMGRLWRWMTGNLDALLMRSRFDAERMKQIGALGSQIHVTGDVKLDALPDDEQNRAEQMRWKQILGLVDSEVLFVAGSTHPGEEEQILEAFKVIQREISTARLLIAPRHIERAEEVEQVICSTGFAVVLRTGLNNQSTGDAVFLLNTVGELSALYAAADVAFVGGSLIERGGHNVLEPLLRGVPVLFGPHVANFREAARFAQDSGGGKMVSNAQELGEASLLWLKDKAKRNSDVNHAREQLREHCGAARRVAELVAHELGKI
jgi:3-deoxy-D-manno-octulosonic-acid transferase